MPTEINEMSVNEETVDTGMDVAATENPNKGIGGKLLTGAIATAITLIGVKVYKATRPKKYSEPAAIGGAILKRTTGKK